MSSVIEQALELPAPPEELYAMYLSAEGHAAFTGQPLVKIAPREGAEFWAFNGMLSGRILALTPGRQIVQAWRSAKWLPADLDSTLILTFRPAPGGARVELVHVNVPASDHADVVQGWPKYYWNPWRAFLAGGVKC